MTCSKQLGRVEHFYPLQRGDTEWTTKNGFWRIGEEMKENIGDSWMKYSAGVRFMKRWRLKPGVVCMEVAMQPKICVTVEYTSQNSMIMIIFTWHNSLSWLIKLFSDVPIKRYLHLYFPLFWFQCVICTSHYCVFIVFGSEQTMNMLAMIYPLLIWKKIYGRW